ncbi:hypothetical protein AKJ16_DCAP17377 [Drosera capensis]
MTTTTMMYSAVLLPYLILRNPRIRFDESMNFPENLSIEVNWLCHAYDWVLVAFGLSCNCVGFGMQIWKWWCFCLNGVGICGCGGFRLRVKQLITFCMERGHSLFGLEDWWSVDRSLGDVIVLYSFWAMLLIVGCLTAVDGSCYRPDRTVVISGGCGC